MRRGASTTVSAGEGQRRFSMAHETTTAGEASPAVVVATDQGSLVTRLRHWVATPTGRVWMDAGYIWATTRAIFLLLTYMVPGLLVPDAQASGVASALNRWVTQDGSHLVYLAQHGYTATIWRANFWPMMPLLEHLLGPIFRGNYGFAGLFVSNVSFLGTLVALRQLAERELGVASARRATLYLAIFPTAFYLFAPYTESLFLWLSISAFAAMRDRRWLLAGVLGCLAMFTRSVGALLVIPFAVEFFQAWRSRTARWWQVAPIALIPSAAALYSGYLRLQHADPLAYVHATGTGQWARSLQWPWMPLVWGIEELRHPGGSHSIALTHLVLNLGATLVFVTLAVAALRSLPLSYGLYTFAIIGSFLFFPVNDPLFAAQGNGRYVLMLFPAFMVLGSLARRPRVHEALLLLMLPMLAIATAHYLLGLANG
jgi:hypothetical protein